MKKSNFQVVALIIVLVLALAVALGGCQIAIGGSDGVIDNGQGTTNQTSDDNGQSYLPDAQGSNVVTYISSDSKVYSTTAQVVSAVADSVVEISTEVVTTYWGRQYIASGAGSGVIIGKEDNTYYIITTILLLYMPVGKLKHLVYYFSARYHLGFFYGWRNVWPQKKDVE